MGLFQLLRSDSSLSSWRYILGTLRSPFRAALGKFHLRNFRVLQEEPPLPHTFQQAAVIAACASAPPESVLSQCGKCVIRFCKHAVVKYNPCTTKEEAENQRIAYELLDSRIVRVPRVYGFSQNEEGLGYIVIEFIDGKIIDLLEDVSAIKKVAGTLDYLALFRSTVPSPLCGGLSRGFFWPDSEDLAFDSLDAMEKWLNSRLLPNDPQLPLSGCELVLCHLDMAPRNILCQDDGSICLLDWESAGYYPRLFEFCIQWILEGIEEALILFSSNQ